MFIEQKSHCKYFNKHFYSIKYIKKPFESGNTIRILRVHLINSIPQNNQQNKIIKPLAISYILADSSDGGLNSPKSFSKS